MWLGVGDGMWLSGVIQKLDTCHVVGTVLNWLGTTNPKIHF